MKARFYLALPKFRNSIGFWKVPRLRTFVPPRATCRWARVWSVGGMTQWTQKCCDRDLPQRHFVHLLKISWTTASAV